MTSIRSPLVLLACGTLLLSVGAAGEGLISKKQTRSLEVAAKDLARAGKAREFTDLVEILRNLGRDPDELAKVEKAGEKSLRNPSPAVRTERISKRLRSVATDMAKGLRDIEADRARHLARLILEIDSDVKAAHVELGHVLHDGRWMSPFMPKALAGRAEVEDILRQARRMPVEIATGTEPQPVLRTLYGTDAHFVRCGGITVYSVTMSVPRLKRILTQTVRALALSRRLCGRDLSLGKSIKETYVHVGSTVKYRDAITEAKRNKGLSEEYASQVFKCASFVDDRGHVLCSWRTESHFMEGVFWFACDAHLVELFGAAPQACLQCGHRNWISLQMFGVPLNDASWFDKDVERRRGPAPSGTPTVETEHTKRMLRIAPGGLHGSRSWIAYLMERRLDPPWRASMLDQHEKIRGNHRMKCTLIAEFLREAGLLGKLMKETTGVPRTDPVAIQKAVEKSLGYDLAEFERRLRAWLLPPGRGLVQRLKTPRTAAKADPIAVVLLDELNLIRAQALRGSTSLQDLAIDPDLSAGCTAHALYLAKNPEQKSRWPDAHEEWIDRPGFTPEGARAGLASVIAFQKKTGPDALNDWMGTFYHRLPLLRPGLLGIGWGLAKGTAVLDCGSLLERGFESDHVVWPFRGMKNVPTRFNPELPNPVPGEKQSAWGFPVTLQIFDFDLAPRLVMRLHVGGADGPAVPCHFTSPERPLNPDLAPRGAWCLIPKKRLAPGTLYTAVAENVPTGVDTFETLEWSFRTAGR
jgi:cysteine-rich secretory family protein